MACVLQSFRAFKPGEVSHAQVFRAGARARSLRAPAYAQTIKIGLVTALSGQSALAGEAITRGLTDRDREINAKGGVLGGASSSSCAATTKPSRPKA